MAGLDKVQREIRDLEEIPVQDRSENDKALLVGYLAKEARLTGNNCVVFIMWLLSGDFISSSH